VRLERGTEGGCYYAHQIANATNGPLMWVDIRKLFILNIGGNLEVTSHEVRTLPFPKHHADRHLVQNAESLGKVTKVHV
jgi:hypothetical protein